MIDFLNNIEEWFKQEYDYMNVVSSTLVTIACVIVFLQILWSEE